MPNKIKNEKTKNTTAELERVRPNTPSQNVLAITPQASKGWYDKNKFESLFERSSNLYARIDHKGKIYIKNHDAGKKGKEKRTEVKKIKKLADLTEEASSTISWTSINKSQPHSFEESMPLSAVNQRLDTSTNFLFSQFNRDSSSLKQISIRSKSIFVFRPRIAKKNYVAQKTPYKRITHKLLDIINITDQIILRLAQIENIKEALSTWDAQTEIINKVIDKMKRLKKKWPSLLNLERCWEPYMRIPQGEKSP